MSILFEKFDYISRYDKIVETIKSQQGDNFSGWTNPSISHWFLMKRGKIICIMKRKILK
jgi:hypothetical protein